MATYLLLELQTSNRRRCRLRSRASGSALSLNRLIPDASHKFDPEFPVEARSFPTSYEYSSAERYRCLYRRCESQPRAPDQLSHLPKEGWIELTVGILEQRGIYHAMNPSITVAEGAILSLEEKFKGKLN